jgi:uncharacterized membrane protein (DUF106 family)
MSLFGFSPVVEEFIVSILLTFVLTLSYRFLVNQTEAKDIKVRMKEKQERIKELQKTNPKEANNMANEAMALSGKQMRMTMRPMFITLMIVGVVLPWMSTVFSGIIINLPFYSALFKSTLGWLVGSEGMIKPWLAWYMLVSITANQLFRKMLGVEL